MTEENNSARKRVARISSWCLCAAAVVVVFIVLRHREKTSPTAVQNISGEKKSSTLAFTQSVAPTAAQKVASRAREFPVSVQNGPLAWAAADFKQTNFIRRLAHNDLEYKRMVDENARIFRRQLVYWDETPDLVLQQAKARGESINQLTLPALDGKQVQFEITARDVHPSGLEGMFRGRVVGQPDSFVTLAFYQGRQAFTVLSPAEKLFLDAEAHEPGDVVIKEINPTTYIAGVCGVK